MNDIFRSDKVLQFWPTQKQSAKDRVHATTRFILYLACILYIIRRDVRILVVAAVSLFALYYMYKNGMIRDPEYLYFQKATDGNPMNNGLDNTGPPDRKSLKDKWDEIHPFMEGRWFSEHNFYTAPNYSDNSGFMQNAYGQMQIPRCRDDSRFCDPESRWNRGPERIHQRAL